MTIAYHVSGDPFTNSAATARYSYYGVSGTPTVRMYGNYSLVGGQNQGTMYPAYRAFFDAHKAEPTDLEMGLSSAYDSAQRTGTLDIVVRNTGTSPVSGQLQVALTESHIYYLWQGTDSLHHVARQMLPNASGEAITVPAGDTIMRSRAYAVDPAWVARNCEFVAFVQNTSTKLVYQGARTAIIQRPVFGYVGAPGTFARPGLGSSCSPLVRNIGSQAGVGVSATFSTDDPYITVTSGTASYPTVDIGHDAAPMTPFAFDVAAGCPGDHLAAFTLELSCGDDIVGTMSVPIIITPGSGFSDDMEQGENGWTVSGLNSRWGQTTSRSHTPTHSWACSPTGQYPNMTDMYLTSPYFMPDNGSSLQFWHQYAVELDYDYCMVELNAGGPFWQAVASYTGTLSSWTQQDFDIGFWAGATLRVRFRFISDSSVQGLGWFVDDVLVDPFVAAVADQPNPGLTRVDATANPIRRAATIGYAIPAGSTASLYVCDAAGRAVARLGDDLTGQGRATWNLGGPDGRRVANGTYFARLAGAASAATAKLVVTE